MLVHRYKTDLRCGACVARVGPLLDAAPDIARWSADVTDPNKVLTVEGEVTAERVADVIGPAGYHVLGEIPAEKPAAPIPLAPAEKPTSYFPLLLVLFYLVGLTAAMEVAAGSFDVMRAMSRFMAGFFVVFSFFKLLDVRAFADAYRSYDVVAAKWPAYGYAYPFIELGLGVAYLTNFVPLVTNAVTLVVMGVSAVGVVKAVAAKRKIRCACLGTVFNLPMSKVTLIEDGLMIAMAAAMLVLMAM
ncbi:MAG: heavy-metal-associated domain-containing protein [Planctomycetes bacterium]|nr:heavy-metal-associated domain-containing protein [Planctomycetota bacterium]